MMNPCKLWIQISDERIVGSSISGLVVEYIVAIDVTRDRFPASIYDEPLQILDSDLQ